MGLILSLNMVGVWAYSGAVRGKTKTAINKEDSAQFKAPLVDHDPPARLAHSFAYLGGKQPWRTIAFTVGSIATLALMVNLVLLLVRGPTGA